MQIDPISPMAAVFDSPAAQASSTAAPPAASPAPAPSSASEDKGGVVAVFAQNTVVYQLLNARGDVVDQLPSQQVRDMRRDIETMLAEARAKNPMSF